MRVLHAVCAMLCAVLLWGWGAAPANAMPEVQEVASAQGVSAWLIDSADVPIITLAITFKHAGFASDPAAQMGRAVMASRLLDEGAGTRDGEAFQRALEEHAIRLDAKVEEDSFTIQLQTLREHRAVAFALLADALMRPRDDSDALARIQADMLSDVAQLEQHPGYQAAMAWRHLAFGAHPYGQRERGTPETLRAITAKDIKQYRAQYWTRDNMLISVAGDIRAEELRDLLDRYFADVPKAKAAVAAPAEVTLPTQGASAHITRTIPQTVVMFGLQGVKRDDPDFFTAFVLNYVLAGGGMQSRLMQDLRQEKGLVYSVSAGLEPLMHGAVWRGQLATRNEAASEAIAALRTVLARVQAQGVSTDELTQAKQYLTGSFVLSLDSSETLVYYLTLMQLNQLGRDYLRTRNQYIEAVSEADMRRVTQRLIHPEALLLAIVGPDDASPKAVAPKPATAAPDTHTSTSSSATSPATASSPSRP